MRVAQVIDTLQWGGVQTLQLCLAEAARERGLELTVINLRGQEETPYKDRLRTMGVSVVTFPAKTLLNLKRFRDLTEFLRNERFDIVHTHLSSANIVGGLAAFWNGIPAIATMHLHAREPHQIRQRLETCVLRLAMHRITAVGHAVAEAHRGRFGDKPVEVIHNCAPITATLSTEERKALRRSFGIDADALVLVSVGRLTAEKGYPDLLLAFTDVLKFHSSAYLLIIGSGPMQTALEKQIRNLKIQARVRLLGPRNDVPWLLSASNMYVSASLTEGLSVSTLEAMACGLPVVVTKVGDMPHLVTERTGILVPPGAPEILAQAVITLLNNRERMLSLGSAAKSRVNSHYSVQQWFGQLLSLYKEVLGVPLDSPTAATTL